MSLLYSFQKNIGTMTDTGSVRFLISDKSVIARHLYLNCCTIYHVFHRLYDASSRLASTFSHMS